MKKKIDERPPSAASLREIPEVHFSKKATRGFRGLPRMMVEGYTAGPEGGKRRFVSPEEVQATVRWHLNGRVGRPERGKETGATTPRSIRFPKKIWAELERRAKKEGKPLHAAMRTVLLDWLKTG
jgi:hypothetical protein